jgi:hypothetical protein
MPPSPDPFRSDCLIADAAAAADALKVTRQQAPGRWSHKERSRYPSPWKPAAAPGRITVAELPKPPDWSRASCVAHPDPDLWTSTDPGERQEAARICRSCPVIAACLAWSLHLPAGDKAVYAGLGPPQRIGRRAENREAAGLAELRTRSARAAQQAAKERCDHGHKLAGSNVRLVQRPNGSIWRVCRECKRIQRRKDDRLRRQRLSSAA